MTSAPATAHLIWNRFPIGKGFRSITSIHHLEAEEIETSHRLDGTESFHEAHFPGLPVSLWVILTEVIVQTGLVALWKFLPSDRERASSRFFFTKSQVVFSAPVYPGQEIPITARTSVLLEI
jgi:3-hydroxymyristoyl/3-hydroxydecanoyl-(acyl carrier protein) dehydratase